MKKIILVFLIYLLGLFSTDTLATNITPTPSPTQDSYALFYPVVAGKVEGDSLYWLKQLRDQVTEIFSFGDQKKFQISLNLATKKLLETEKLLKNNQHNYARKTLLTYKTKLESAQKILDKSSEADYYFDMVEQMEKMTSKYLLLLPQFKILVPQENQLLLEESVSFTSLINIKTNEDLGS